MRRDGVQRPAVLGMGMPKAKPPKRDHMRTPLSQPHVMRVLQTHMPKATPLLIDPAPPPGAPAFDQRTARRVLSCLVLQDVAWLGRARARDLLVLGMPPSDDYREQRVVALGEQLGAEDTAELLRRFAEANFQEYAL